jgi:hypothetical protein
VGHHLDGYLLVFLIERERENVDDVTLERQKLTEETLILGTLLDRLKFAASHPLLGFYWPGRLHVSPLLSSPLLSSQLLPSIYNRDHHGSDWMKDLPLDSIRLLFYILKKFPFNFFFIFIPSMESIN